jgi:hypothetical protein
MVLCLKAVALGHLVVLVSVGLLEQALTMWFSEG